MTLYQLAEPRGLIFVISHTFNCTCTWFAKRMCQEYYTEVFCYIELQTVRRTLPAAWTRLFLAKTPCCLCWFNSWQEGLFYFVFPSSCRMLTRPWAAAEPIKLPETCSWWLLFILHWVWLVNLSCMLRIWQEEWGISLFSSSSCSLQWFYIRSSQPWLVLSNVNATKDFKLLALKRDFTWS